MTVTPHWYWIYTVPKFCHQSSWNTGVGYYTTYGPQLVTAVYISQTNLFFVALDDVFSDAGLMNCGVSQESILGHLHLLIYIND